MCRPLLILAVASTFFVTLSEATTPWRDQCRTCPKNEVWDSCPALCPPRECGVDPAVILCAVPPKPGDPECEPGCRCRDNYLRDYNGVCIPKDKCPNCTKANEVYDVCPLLCPPQRCDVDEREYDCAAPPRPGDPECEPGCRCAGGYVRNYDEECVTRDQCSNCTKANEVYDVCPVLCPPQRCDVDERTYDCAAPPRPGDPECEPGCRCADGYVRSYDEECVTRDQCTRCPRNEVYDECPAKCPPQRCDVDPRVICCAAPPKPGDPECEPGCRCIDDYVRNNEGVCVTRDQCPKCTKPHEVYERCPPNCPPQTCESLDRQYKCPKQPSKRDKNCEGACRCEPGYYRNKIGECISEENCRKCNGPHEYFSCGVPCDNVCANLREQNQTSCPIASFVCTPMCYCETGYARDENNICIPIEKCPVPKCGQNEIYSDNPAAACRPLQCSEVGFPVACPAGDSVPYGKPACICKEGYVKDDTGCCIPIRDCPSCGGDPNAVSGCGVNCGRHCSDYMEKDVACIEVCYTNACDCRDGFVLDENKKQCVRPKECTPVCGENEVYSNCTNGGCGPKECSGLGFKIGCVKMDLKYCKEGCLCKEGYLRDDKGKCIPKRKCPECGGDPNAVAGCGVNCGRYCSNYKNSSSISCAAVCYDDGCDCRKGFVVNDDTGLCVRPEECPNCTKPNEVYDVCPVLCPPQRCDVDERVYDCAAPPRTGDPECEPGCQCSDGYVRNYEEKCVTRDQCSNCTKANEVYDVCPVLCPPQRCDVGERTYDCAAPPRPGDPECEPGCRCADGYVRSYDEECVTRDQCSRCPRNEVYDECPAKCPPQRCGVDPRVIRCAAPPKPGDPECEPGCRCIDDYVRNYEGVCVTRDQCPRCPRNEVYDECPAKCPPQRCDVDPRVIRCAAPPKPGDPECEPGCRCIDDYVRNYEGVCVTRDQCPPRCGKNEKYVKCPDTLCTPQNCSQLGLPWPAIPCPAPGDGPCPGPPGCVCIDDYVRDDKGNCIPKQDCPPRCGVNEVYDTCGNGGCRRWNCSQPTLCIDPLNCEGRCVCIKDYARADNGTCIPEDQCDRCYKPHEYFDSCAPTCPPQTCESIDRQYKCPAQPLYCRGACRCEKGYYRNKRGDCITKAECKKCTGPHEYFACGGACDNVCANITKQNQTNCPIVNVKCNDMCYCEEGYARDDKRICIPIKDCPVPRCADDERYEQCPDNLCTPQKCSQLGYPINCPALSGNSCPECPGKPGCVCDNDYVRDDNGKCIPKDQCPSCGGDPNAVSGCGINCGRRCSNYKKKNVVCPLICKLNGCDCREGYVYDDNLKQCVLPEDCTSGCGRNEVYDTCANGGCRQRNCSRPVVCVRPIKCEGGCICQEGFTRDKNGNCIPIDQCPENCNKPHEKYDECAKTCPPNTCESIGKVYHCPIQPAVCRGACLCEKGYYRNKIGQCISEEDCKKCTGPHEYFSCGGACDNVCATINKQNQTNCPIVNIVCNRMCYCEKGYARDKNKICIPIEECPAPQCKDDERFEECPDNLCEPTSCSELGFPINCTDSSGNPYPTCPGKPGCVCDYGNVRDANGKCIPREKCPSCGGDPNAVSGCGINCGRRCSNYKDKNVACTLMCKLNGCDCREGYVYDDNLKQCVLPKDCTPGCGMNEVYDTCANGGCRQRNCSSSVVCARPIKCKGGCICQEGFTRDKNGNCIPIDQCPENCNKPHEKYDECARTCPPNTCESIGKVYPCPIQPAVCRGACLCEKGYYRNKIGQCISEEDCKKCTGPHEYFSCGGACDNVCATINKQNQTNCPIVNIVCNRMCYCEKGYARDKNKICIPIEECPAPQCKDDERFEECPDNLCEPTSCSELGFPINCADSSGNPYPTCPGKPGCVCDYGNVRDANGKCIPREKCPSCGGDPNAVSGCGINCGRRCSNYKDKNVACTLMCKLNGCDCREGYVYDDNLKQCVLPKDCTPGCGMNEVYDTCANGGCRQRNCSSSVVCARPIKCKGGCICQEGFTRDKNGNCIPIDQCPENCNKPHEKYDECARTCPPNTCESIGKVYPCPIQPAVCRGACLCEKGYYRNKIGQCISEEDCKKCTGPHEYFSCGGACDNVCATINKQNQTNCPIVNIVCNRMCYCEKGYARDKNKICIPIEECPAPQCKDDERFEECPDNLCEPTSCSELGFPINCTDSSGNPYPTCPGKPGCVCDYGNVRDVNGKCIPREKCPSCGGDPNAVSGCGINCGRRCSNYKDKNVVCPRICLLNGCDCKEGYVFDDNLNKCVKPENCTQTCGQNEVYNGCANGGCRKLKCSQPIICRDPIKCEGGCICQEGYTRDDNGVCIREDQCPGQCNKPHEYYDECAQTCPPQTCESIGKTYHCPLQPAVCKGACRCEKGYYRNKIGQCISEKNCKKCLGPHEYFSCGGACDNVCNTLYKQNQTNCPIKNIKCNDKCYCEKGYARDANNICIPIEKCPEPTCGLNERFEQCPAALCEPQSCSQLGFPIACPDIAEGGCPGTPDCVCDNGYVRDDNGICIPKKDCPSCGGDPNAVSGCGLNCGRLCSNYNKGPVPCPRICKFNACDCKKDYVLDQNTNTCVRPKDCTPVCGDNEEYSDCINGGCQAKNCSQLGKPVPCVKIDPKYCIKGCLCIEGYLRAKNGTCIPEDQCPTPKCPKGQRFVKCPETLCSPLTCSQVGYPVPCVDLMNGTCPGSGQCVCNDEKVKDDNGNCIPKTECPTCGGDPNAVSGCGGHCGNRCSDYKKKDVACLLICQVNGCDCRKGYVYDDNKKQCVLPEHCSPPCVGENEVYDSCANGGCNKRNCSQLAEPMLCIDPIECRGGCVCKPGYLRTEEGVCVSENECPAPCNRPHEVYNPCGPICPPQTCESLDRAYVCPIVTGNDYCVAGCRCEEGYYRNAIGECISEEDCRTCSGPNEYFSCGVACDNVCSTLQERNQTHCPIINKKCNPMCYCEEGYARDDNDICIPIEQCEGSCNGDRNALPGCGINCGRRCSDYRNGPTDICPDVCLINGCDCKDNYVYDENLGTCVIPKDCTPTCEQNEEFSDCINGGSQIKNCSQLDKPEIYVIPEDCTKGCICREGYLRHDNGTCVPVDQCEETCNGDPNAVPGCGVNCGRHCSDYNIGPVSCIQVCYENACDCKPDYVFDDNIGKCVLPEYCTRVCGANETYDSCSNKCDIRKCSELTMENPIICEYPLECIGDCVCKQRFLRDENGVCVPEAECKPKCGPHEVYDACPPNCPPNTCESIGKAYSCPANVYQNCVGACVCEAGYFRNQIGECITKKECLRCTGPHEYFSCGVACDNVCATLNKQSKSNCPIEGNQCMCYCEEGYARDSNNICIPIEDSGELRCSLNERYEENPSSICEPMYCYELGFPIDCSPENCNCGCEERPACICIEGYVRNSEGVCIPKSKCPSCGGDSNAVAGCGVLCGKTCEDYGKNITSCIQVCYPNACDCREGFLYDEAAKKCVTLENCSTRPKDGDGSTSPPSNLNNTAIKEKLDRGTISLSNEFIYQLSQSRPNENFVCSATSLLTPLAQIAYYAKDLVLKQLLGILNLDSKEEIKSYYPELIASYRNQKDVEFEEANKYFFNENYELSSEYQEESQRDFGSTGEKVDFGQNKAAAKIMNDYVSNRTRGRIQDLVSPDSLDANTVVVLVNALYFLGNWRHQFNPNDTQKRDFTKRDNTVVQLDTMYQQNTFNYAENNDLKVQALEMPYKNPNFTFLVMLPKLGEFDNFVQALRDPRVFQGIVNDLRREKIEVYLPKMLINSNMDMAEMLKKANVTEMFDRRSDGFRGILKDNKPLYISAAVQKAFLQCDETGTEAAAATAIIVTRALAVMEPSQVFIFDANRSYLFFLLYNRSPMFCGSFVGAQ